MVRGRSAARSGRVLLAVLVLFAAAGCARQHVIAGTGHPSARGSSNAEPVRTVWQRTDLHVVGGPVAAAGRLLVLVAVADSTMQLQGLDPATGATVWAQPYSPSGATSGVPVDIAVINDRVVDLLPGPDRQSLLVSVVGLDAVTGQQVWSAFPIGYVDSAPTVCGSASNRFCLTWKNAPETMDMELAVLDPTSGQVTATFASVPRDLGNGLYDGVGEPPSVIRGIDVDTGAQWSRSVASLFGAGHDTNKGWFFDRRGQTIFGTIGSDLGGDTSYQFGHDETVAFNATTGLTEWAAPGAFRCGLDAPGSAFFLCQQTGSVTYAPSGVASAWSADYSATLEGFDPASGSVTWTLPLGRSETATAQRSIAVAGTDSIGVVDATGFVVLSLSTGHIQRPVWGQLFWCTQGNMYSIQTDVADASDRVGWEFYDPCDATGKTSDRLPTYRDDIGITSGKLFIWSAPGGLRAVTT